MTFNIPKKLQVEVPIAKRHSTTQEKNLAKRVNGKTTSGSGNKSEKGDIRCRGVVRIECKCTSKKSYSLTKQTLQKIDNAALAAGEVPALVIEFLNKDGVRVGEYLVMPSYAIDLIIGDNNVNK